MAERLTYTINGLPKEVSDIFKKGIEQYAENKKKVIISSFKEGVDNDLYTVDEARKILLEKWNEFYSKYQLNQKNDPDFMKSKADEIEQLKEKIEKNEIETTHLIYGMVRDLNHLQKIFAWTKSGRKHWPEDTLNYYCTDEVCQKAIQEIIEGYDLEKSANELEMKNKEKEELKKEMLSYCKSHFARESIKDYETSDFVKLIPKVKEALMNNVISKYSELSQNNFSSYLQDELDTNVHKSTPSMAEWFINDIDKKYKNFKENPNEKSYDNYDFKNYIDQLLSYETYDSGEIDLTENNEICNDYPASVAWDGFYTGEGSEKDAIDISPFSCTHHSFGKGILAHELGHALSNAFQKNKLSKPSYEKFMELRQCTNSLNKQPKTYDGPRDIEHPGDQLTTEEDMADLISVLVIPDKSLLYNCALLEPKIDGKSYLEVALHVDYLTPHSPPLVRILREAIHKRVALPASCRELMEQNKDNFRFEPCF